ncbi:TPA: DUF2732 family protein [Yersinia enterocolitica]|nr:DUF2732 family protein [Yersinia enterocolitica]PNK72642.1 DUF2732 domain-containing protein [Yersinia enterocolitica]PNK76623.1 DUF2732 domain-containing protein [Yersinia enterocolitica]
MHMYKTIGQDMHTRALEQARQHQLNQARKEAKADAAISFSSYLDRLATHAANQQLSSSEIVELLRQESEQFQQRGFECHQSDF